MLQIAQTLVKTITEFEWCEFCHNLAIQELKNEIDQKVK